MGFREGHDKGLEYKQGLRSLGVEGALGTGFGIQCFRLCAAVSSHHHGYLQTCNRSRCLGFRV